MKMFQIHESDLEVLERELPEILNATLESCNDSLVAKRWESVIKVISNVRWNYGPPASVKVIEHEP